jgi:DnaJ-domain-containing protein 1
MPQLLIAIAVIVGGLWIIRKFARTPQTAVPGLMQKMGGFALIGFSGLLAMRGSMNIAIPVFVFGLGLLGKGAAFPNGFNWPPGRKAGQKSRVATSMLAMEMDHDSGGMEGEILSGPMKGRLLSKLGDTELKSFHDQCRSTGDQSQALLEAWLDRAKPEWRDVWGSGKRASSTSGPMGRDEALAILGLKKNATADEVKSAHKRLMKDFHPDKGGSDYLAAKINAAKDLLLNS